ncbi:hypothetical protein PYCCODRAFT_1427802 [Trametes coccinea BRFM310]|uniref:Uncharacterized protein n=1 Tax=Trametes coccinea (strain BRFM310) TaxID=1353009 RepID=A0A1Y2IBR3_TRAC3|nr:hypothetical protein PYCCODRAFT_1427802 [Trametes coccinea BRFM310]
MALLQIFHQLLWLQHHTSLPSLVDEALLAVLPVAPPLPQHLLPKQMWPMHSTSHMATIGGITPMDWRPATEDASPVEPDDSTDGTTSAAWCSKSVTMCPPPTSETALGSTAGAEETGDQAQPTYEDDTTTYAYYIKQYMDHNGEDNTYQPNVENSYDYQRYADENVEAHDNTKCKGAATNTQSAKTAAAALEKQSDNMHPDQLQPAQAKEAKVFLATIEDCFQLLMGLTSKIPKNWSTVIS